MPVYKERERKKTIALDYLFFLLIIIIIFFFFFFLTSKLSGTKFPAIN
jgi:hypothetical protein